MSWESPEDDGGTPISQYVVNMMDLTVNEWVIATETKDKSAEIKGLKPGHLYRYKFCPLQGLSLDPRSMHVRSWSITPQFTGPGEATWFWEGLYDAG